MKRMRAKWPGWRQGSRYLSSILAIPATAAALFTLAATPLQSTVLPGEGDYDTRHRVDMRLPPWSDVARLQVPGISRCTAALIGPRTALTAAHCLYGRRLGHFVPPESVHVLAGYGFGAFGRHTVVTTYRIAAGYDPARPAATLGADLAVLTLADPLTSAGLPLGSAAMTGEPVMLGGYNQDRAEIIEADLNCRLTGRAYDGADRPLIRHDCTATHGTSGAPVLVQVSKGAWGVVGINVAAFDGQIGGLSIPVETLRRVLQALPQVR
jgi:protease YdgD